MVCQADFATEILERARSAEASLTDHLGTKKAFEDSTKKAMTEMTTQLKEAQLAKMKAESESNALRDGVKSLREGWAREVKAIKEEMRSAQEASRKERDDTVSSRSLGCLSLCSSHAGPEASSFDEARQITDVSVTQ